MGSSDVGGDSFIVKVWLEHPATKVERARWRGHVTHAVTGQRRHIQRLDDIPLIIMPYLEAVGVRFGARWHLRNWLFKLQRTRRYPR